MNIAALALLALLATAPATAPTAPATENQQTVEYVPLDQVPDWYTTKPYKQTGVCMFTARDVTCATDTQWKHVTLHDRYTQALHRYI